jgi:hypothetical protein
MAEGGERKAGKRRTRIQKQKQEPHTKMWGKTYIGENMVACDKNPTEFFRP